MEHLNCIEYLIKMKTFYSRPVGRTGKRLDKNSKRPTPTNLKNFILSKHAALTAWMLAENVCEFQWKVMEWLGAMNSKSVDVWPNELSLYHSKRTKTANFRPGDTGASRMAIGVQKLCKTKSPRLLLVPVSLFINPVYKGKDKDEERYYADNNWETIHQLGLVVDPVTKTYYLFEPSRTLAIFSDRVKIRLSALFKLIGFKEQRPCNIANSSSWSDDLCVSWMIYFFAMVILNPSLPPSTIRSEMNYKGLLECLYYLFTTFRWPFDEDQCAIYTLGDEFPEMAIDPNETLKDASRGLDPHEFDAIDVFGLSV